MQTRFLPCGWRVICATWCATLAAAAWTAADAQAQVTQSISQQGRLLSSGGFPVPDGAHKFTIGFYGAQTGGAPLWTYTDPSVPVVQGVFTVPIIVDAVGMAQFVAGAPAWVGMALDADSELPRIPMRQVPFALVAQQALALTCSSCVTGGHIADGTIGNVDLAAGVLFGSVQPGTGATGTAFNVTNGSSAIKFAAGANATVAVDNVNHVVTIGATPQGSVASVTAGAGLTGGTITNTGTIAIASGGVSNTMIQFPNVTVAPGTGLSGGGAISLGGTATLNNTGTLSVSASPPLAITAGQNPTLSLSTTLAGLTAAQVLKWSGAAWSNAFLDASELTGVLTAAKGGTGLTSPGTAGNYLRSNGTLWTSSAISAADVPSLAASYVDLSSNQAVGGTKTWSALGSFAAGILLNNAASNKIAFAGGGVAAPTTTSTSAGTKIVYFPAVSSTLVDYAMGVETGPPAALWYSVPAASASYAHKWYGGTSQIMLLKGDGTLAVSGAVTAPSFVGAFSGNGSALTALNPAAVSAGTMAGVNITGNAATATTATSATTATNATNATFATNAGNASTVTNGVYTNGTYADPAWISSLAASKIVGTVGSAGSATTATTATNFSAALAGDVTGNQNATSVQRIAGVAVTSAGASTGLVLKYNGTQWAPGTDDTGSSDVKAQSGAGTANSLPKWVSSTSLANSSISDNGSTISLAPAASSGARLDITNPTNAGVNLRTNFIDFHGDNTASSDRPYFRGMTNHLVLSLAQAGGGTMYLNYPEQTSGSVTTRVQESLFIGTNGNVGLGTAVSGAATPSQRLDVFGNVQMEQNDYINFVANSSGGALTVGGNSRQGTGASVATSTGNLHLDAATGGYGIYMNWYGATGGVNIGNGSAGYGALTAGTVTSAGNIFANSGTMQTLRLDGAYVPRYQAWSSVTLGDGGAGIFNDNGSYKKLMVVGNSSAGGAREIGLWDNLTVNGNTTVSGNVTVTGRVYKTCPSGFYTLGQTCYELTDHYGSTYSYASYWCAASYGGSHVCTSQEARAEIYWTGSCSVPGGNTWTGDMVADQNGDDGVLGMNCSNAGNPDGNYNANGTNYWRCCMTYEL